jgi:F0F1-type ATP synthase alpha subunit
VKSIGKFESEFLEYLDNKYPDIFDTITKEKILSDELKNKLTSTAEEFLKIFKAEE